MTTPVSRQWRLALALFDEHQTRAHYTDSTRARIERHLRKFAFDQDLADPFEATPAQLLAWFDDLSCTPRAVYGYRTSLRTFYRWAHRTGRMTHDPSAVLTAHRRKEAPTTWRGALQEWQDFMRASGASPQTVRLRMQHAKQLAAEVPVDNPWDVMPQDLVEWQSRHNWSRETQRSIRSMIKGFYGWAVDAGYLADNPAALLPRVAAQAPSPKPTPVAALTHARAAAGERELLMLRLSVELGLRRGEVAQVHSRDLIEDVDGWSLRVHGKGGRDRVLPLSASLGAALRARPAGWVFPGKTNGHLAPCTVGELVGRLLPDGVTMHSLRHRFATDAYRVNGDVLAVQQLLGHASPVTTQRYVQVPAQSLRSTVEAVAW